MFSFSKFQKQILTKINYDSHTKAQVIFIWFKILNFNIFGGFLKKKYFLCMKIFWVHHKIGLYLGVISMHFKILSEGLCTEWGYFWGLLKFKIFFGGA